MAVVFDASSDTTAAFGSTTIDLTTLTVGTGSNRALVGILSLSSTGSTGLSCTWDQGGTNQSMTAITGASCSGSALQMQMFGLVAPISGNKTMRGAWTGSTAAGLGGASWTGVDQTGGGTTFPNGTGTTGSGTTASITVTSATNNAILAGWVNAGAATWDSVNNTELYRDNAGAAEFLAANRAAGAASVSMTATQSKSKSWGGAGTDILAAAVVTSYYNLYQDENPHIFRKPTMVGY